MQTRPFLFLAFVLVLDFGAGCGGGDRSEHPKYNCRANLVQIEGSIAMWAQEHKKTTNDVVTWADIVGTNAYISHMPVCPRGGSYSITRVGELPSCSIAEDDAYFKKAFR